MSSPIYSSSYYDAARWPGEIKDAEALAIVNEGSGEGRCLFHFGAYGGTHVLVVGVRNRYGEVCLEDALDAAVDWVAEHAPGLLADEQVHEAYKEAFDGAIAEGISEEEAQERAQEEAETDVTIAGNEGHYRMSDEWNVTENPSREQILELLGRSEVRAKGKDPRVARRPGNVKVRWRKPFGPYVCKDHDDCRAHPALGAACRNGREPG